MKRKKLEALLREWQQRLDLMDWDIEIKLEHAIDMDDCAGKVDRYPEHKMATIYLIDPKTAYGDYSFPYSLEHTLIHELLHLHSVAFDGFKEGGHKETALEVMINKTAKALLELKEAKK